MTTVIQTLPTTFTGGNSASLPILPYTLPTTPKYRWLADSQSVIGAITTVQPTAGGIALTGTASVATDGTRKTITTNGTTNYLSALGIADAKTLMFVGRVTAAPGTNQGIFTAGAQVNRVDTTSGTRVGATGFTTQFLATKFDDPGDHIIIISLDGTTLRWRTEGVNGEASSTGTMSTLEFGRSSLSGALYGALAIRELVLWPTALTVAESAANLAAANTKWAIA